MENGFSADGVGGWTSFARCLHPMCMDGVSLVWPGFWQATDWHWSVVQGLRNPGLEGVSGSHLHRHNVPVGGSDGRKGSLTVGIYHRPLLLESVDGSIPLR